jgi:polyketide synthase PksN
MIDQELLQDLTESYLKAFVVEVSDSVGPDFDSFAPFGELGIDSFRMLKIIKKLEADFGTLPKSLLFENFTIHSLANYFATKHEHTLAAKFAENLQGSNSLARTNGHLHPTPIQAPEKAKVATEIQATAATQEVVPIRILEKEAYTHPELREVVQALFNRYKIEGCVSRGTRKIAPNLFIGSAKRGYFNYGRSKNILLVYGYTGPRDYLPALIEEMYRYCDTNDFQLNILADKEIPSVDGVSFSATPFGALQRITNLKEFALDGKAMRRLRYQVSRFQKAGICRTEEYRCGSNPDINKNIAKIIDRWCEARTMVNPLVYDVKSEILAGTLSLEHRLFLTYLDDVLQNVILITEMSSEQKGYLMDLEFYPPDMPLGGLEFAIVEIIKILVAEGCDVLSLGGTYGCKLDSCANADPEIDKILDELRAQNIFNDEGNLQFKNKFRPENKAILLCRPVGSKNPDNVLDVIMMVADPEKMQTSDEENHSFSKATNNAARLAEEPAMRPAEFLSVRPERFVVEGNERSSILSEFGFNPLNIPYELIEFDLKTDSWAELRMPSIDAQIRQLRARLQQPVNIDDSLKAIFPFAHFVLTPSGKEAEHIFFKAWPKKGVVLENLLFPSTIFHQIDKGFESRELPHPAVFDLISHEKYKSNMDWEALQAQVAQDPSAVAFVCIEVSNNAAGGYPVSMQHLRNVKALLVEHSIPLVMDGTRVVENARFLIEEEKEYAGKSIWTVVREILTCADAVIGSLTKDFCVNKGGIIATNDVKLFHKLQKLVHEERTQIDLIDKKVIALSLQNHRQIEARVLRRMEGVRRIWQALNHYHVPIVQPAGGHCILIDVKQLPEFKDFKYPVASFLAWLYLNTGIRASAHSAGMQTQTSINDLVRLAIPVGLTRDQIDDVIDKLVQAFDQKSSIPEIAMKSNAPQPLGAVYARYELAKCHRVTGGIVERTGSAIPALGRDMSGAHPLASVLLPPSPKAALGFSSCGMVKAEGLPQEPESTEIAVTRKSRRTRDIAIVGMAGRYPKAKNMKELWENLAQGRDCIEDIPADRYEGRLHYRNTKKYRGGFINNIDKFDSLFFNISPREAEMLDPQERLFLEVAWEAIEDAGYCPEILAQENPSRNIGVFVGSVWAMYQMLGVEEMNAGNKMLPNSFLWSIANRVSYCLNLSGPSLTVDTACSSSLTAIYLACEAIYGGECSAAIVGGVNLDLHQAKLDINLAGGALSKDGVCRSFGKGANGYVAGEGVGALFLKPLDQAVQERDNIYGVIKSAVVNHGGRTSGYTVPNPKAQANLISSALEKAKIRARSIGYIEAHGTGTELGDPIEISGLRDAFGRDNVESQTCAIGSIKTNIGHLEAAAGIVSVSKVLLQMKHRQLVPSLHSSELSEFIDFKNSPFYVVQRLEEWKAKEVNGVRFPLRAGISAFGAGGSNAHIILEEYEPIEKTKKELTQPKELIFPLSAKTEDQLREAAERLAEFIQENQEDLNDVAHTLQIGRKSFEHRLAIIATTKEELLEKLMLFIAGKKNENIATAHMKSAESITRLLSKKEKEEFTALLLQRREPRKLAALWVEGLLPDWAGLQTHASAKRVSLPTYPFADKRHWAHETSPIRHSLQPVVGMHPMIDTNESTFERQLFKKTFHERDFFIYDHHVANIPTLPGVAYLELVRKAGELAAGRKVQKIRNIVWVSPIAVQNSIPKEVFIELKPNEATVRVEVFSNDDKGNKVPHCQGTLLYETKEEAVAEAEYIELESIRARCAKVNDGKKIYPLFKSFGLNLGPSFQVLQEVYKNENEVLGRLKLPEFRQGELASMILHPSLIDGSLQSGVGAQLGDKVGEMFVPFSIGEVEILYPLQSNCFSYVTAAKEDKKEKREKSQVVKSNLLIVDETGKVLIKIRESMGVPLRKVHKKAAQDVGVDGFSTLYYSYDWEKAPLAVERVEQPDQRAVILFDTQEILLGGLYRDRLIKAGANSGQIISVRPGESYEDLGEQSYKINPQNKDDFTRLFESLIEKQCSIENICFAWPVGQTDLHNVKGVTESLERGVYPFLFLCQSLIQQKLENKVQLLYLYSAKPNEPRPSNEAMTGFINTLHLEHPKLLCKSLEVRQESIGRDQIFDAATAEFQAHTQDATAVRYEAQGRYIKRLKAFDPEKDASSAPSQGVALREKGVYLITGGAGGLGLIFAEFLAKEYRARLALTGRSKLSVEKEARLEEIRKFGAEVLYVRGDISNHEDVENVVSEAKSRFGEIHGIIHAAGVLRDSLIRNKTTEEMRAVFAPKVYGTLHLDDVTKNDGLDFFVTFSSLAAVGGNAGQCDYSFANYFMDSFASERELLRAKGTRSGKTLSLNWSIWADGGMKLDEQPELYFRKTLGIKPLSAGTGLEAFARGLVSERNQFAVLEGVQEKVEVAWGLRKKNPAPTAPVLPAFSDPTAIVPASGETSGDIAQWLQDELSQIVMQLLKLDASDISTDKILLDLGFDSIGLTTFANAVNEKFQLDLTPVLFFDYPTVGEIAKYLAAERASEVHRFYQGAAPATEAAAPPTQSTTKTGGAEIQPAATFNKGWAPAVLEREAMPKASGGGFSTKRRVENQPIAIVGMSGVMPQSENLEEFWENLKNSKDMITIIPPDRWRWEDYYGDPLKEVNKSNSKWGGFMKEVDKFDPLFFGISPREAQTMDPQQRIFLETVWKAIEDSGHKVSDLSNTKTGLFVGVATNDYINVMSSLKVPMDGYSASGNSHCVLANRVSFLLNLRGPSAPIDTACSSSLVALHRAVESIQAGSCDMAIVGGVQIMLTPMAYISFGMAGMLSSDGKCKTFDKRANGYVRGEGCGAIFLKPLSVAEADGDHIYAVVKATAENHGGRVTTLTAPNSAAQTALLIDAYEKGQIDPATVGYVECHGTGTSLGDPIEIQALTRAFSELYKRHNKAPVQTPHCVLSSVKTNIGHLETAAGIASVLKVLLAIKHKQIPANIHFEEINPYINLSGTPFYIADKLTPWKVAMGDDKVPLPRRAGVSSFGFGGANAHIVLEEYIPRNDKLPTQAHEPQLIVLSARNEDRLKAYIQAARAHLEKEDIRLVDLAYTLQVGRDEMEERLALVTSSVEDLKNKFDDILKDERPPNSYRNNARKHEARSQTAGSTEEETLVQTLLEQNELSELAELWVSGTKVNWHLLHKSATPRRLSVPAYPFARERYWIPSTAGAFEGDRPLREPIPATFLHPLIHRNVSTRKVQKFASRFTGAEFYLADHSTKTGAVMPAAAYIEMVAAAGELWGEQKCRRIQNMFLLAPLAVKDDAREVEVSLMPAKNNVDFLVRTLHNNKNIVHCRGTLAYSETAAGHDALNIAEIQTHCCDETIAGIDLYPFLCKSELNFGKSFRVVQTVSAGKAECLAVLQLPDHLKEGAGQFWLHPALLDGGMHAAIGLAKKNKEGTPWCIPYSISEIQIFRSVNDVRYAYATWKTDAFANDKSYIKINLYYLDKNGTCLVRIKDLICKPFLESATKAKPRDEVGQHERPKDQPDTDGNLRVLVPVWNPLRPETSSQILAPESTKILLLGRDQTELKWIQKYYPNSQLLQLAATSTVDVIESMLSNCVFDQLLWIAPDAIAGSSLKGADNEFIIDQQDEGVLTIFRVTKALLRLGYANKNLKWTIITSRTQWVTRAEAIQPGHAGVVGLVGSLAKEYPQWDLRLLDIDSPDVPAQECLSLPWSKQGNGLACRQGEWFQQELASLVSLPQTTKGYRQKGVYVVIGGAGGIGEVWSRYMIENYQANMVWIGRRECNTAIEEKIKSLSQLGPAPLYISADATNLAAMERALGKILERYPTIHGVVHSAVILHDLNIARMEECEFRASLSTKVDIAVNMDRVFGQQELDFMLFFSSITSFVKPPGQANYSAGCTFKDSFAQKLRQERPYPIKIMNWGYWGSVGIVADEAHKKIMAHMGVGSIEPQEGMASLQAFVNSEVGHVAVLKTLTVEAADRLNLSESITCYQGMAATILPQVERRLAEQFADKPVAALEIELPTSEMNGLATQILASSLMSLGLFNKGLNRIADLPLDQQPAPYYERWLSYTRLYLQEQKVLAGDLTFNCEIRTLAELWAEWRAKREIWKANGRLEAQIALLETCLEALPRILSAKQLATAVMFPNSSLQLVESIYRGNAVADHFNEVLCETLVACVEHQLGRNREHKIRILEIGAGTGATTRVLLPRLQGFPIAEYCFTDVSRAFLIHAEQHYQSQFPKVTTAIFDVSKPLCSQAIAADHYDFAIAANVLHATPNIRETVRNVKAALRNQGVLLLNEISTWSLFSHLTFGLLEGWWLHEDNAVRLAGSPALAPEKWRMILANEGFKSICFPAEKAHKFGQQIVVAASNGWVRQRVRQNVDQQSYTVLRASKAKHGDAVGIDNPKTVNRGSSSGEVTEETRSNYVRHVIAEKLSEALRMDAAAIHHDVSFADYGVDSIIGVSLVQTINEALQIEIETIRLFEYSTVDQLVDYILKEWQEEISAQLAGLLRKPSDAANGTRSEVDAPSETRMIERDLFTGTNGFRVGHENDLGPADAEAIAVIGMSGRFAESESLDEFWRNLAEGKNLVEKVCRWNPTACVMPESGTQAYCHHGSFVGSIDKFDPAFFGISAQEATYMDPQQRLFLEESWRALEDAGYAGKSVHEKQCGVYVGCGNSDYDRLFTENTPPQAFWGNSGSVIPARIAYYLDLQGPAVAIDTACSSSLVAIHFACQGLWSRETEMALAGGVFLQATPRFYQVANRAGMLSPDGKCHSFAAEANGFVPGEGVGVVVLKRLRDALEDGDYIYGVIAGSGINQDGRSNGLIAPNGRAQERLERSVYERFKINPQTIQVIEAHATGTILGDSIEYEAISRAFRKYTERKQFCAIGSVKTNIGHGATAAGVTSVLKMLLSLKHRQIPPSLHFEKSNPAIDFESGPFYLNTQLQEWKVEDNQTRRAAISSFGFSGTNAHMILEEAPSMERAPIELPGYVVVLSARTSEQLKQQVRNLLGLVKDTLALSMNDLSFSLFVGRMHLTHRLSCLVRNQNELVHLLEIWLETGDANHVSTSELQEGRVREQASLKRFGNYCIQECRNGVAASTYIENLAAIGDLYIQGYALDYPSLFSKESKRIPLPTYPFARERYWVEAPKTVKPVLVAPPASVSHALEVQDKALAEKSPVSVSAESTQSASAITAEDDLPGWLENDLAQLATELLQVDGSEIVPDKVLLDMGFDSVSLTTFANLINMRYRLDITPVLFFEYYTLGDIARHLAEEKTNEILRASREPRTVSFQTKSGVAESPAPVVERKTEIVHDQGHRSAESDSPRTGVLVHAQNGAFGKRYAQEPIAIVGMSGSMPQCEDLYEFWENLRNARDLVTLIPPDRWRWEDFYGDPLTEVNKANSKWGGFMKEVDKFDPQFFGISLSEAQMMDPQQRMFLEIVWKAIEDSGQKVSDLSGTRTGLFVGVGSNDYTDVLRSMQIALDAYTVSGNTHSVLANRISFLLNLRGPSAPIDTACSSSLVALHRAVESMQTGNCDMAIVGGVQIILSPAAYVSFGKAGMLSSEGKCRTFDKRADGYVRGEGCGAVFLKPLSLARADGNHIYAIVRSTAENHGGRVPTMTAPSSSAQTALLIEAYEKAHVDPATVGYIECHGTATVLGDPIEIDALKNAFSELYKKRNKASVPMPHCGLGSVKTNIGHLELASGIAGVLKVVLSFKHKQIPPTIHFEEMNPYIKLKGTPFYIADKLCDWDAKVGENGTLQPRRAGVSSFGFGGANAHVVLEEYIAPARELPAETHEPQLIVVSAKNEDRLNAYLQSIRKFLDRENIELVDLAYTLQVGRDEMPERVAFVAASTEDLKQKLDAILDSREVPQDTYRNNVSGRKVRGATNVAGSQDQMRSLVEHKDLIKLAELWVSGVKVDWKSLHTAGLPRRIPVPTYPFARERCWVPQAKGKTIGPIQESLGRREPHAALQSMLPIWIPVAEHARGAVVVPEASHILVLGNDPAQLEWVKTSYPNATLLQLAPDCDIAAMEEKIGGNSFDQLLWIAPDLTLTSAGESGIESLVAEQSSGALAVFRIVKALLKLGYGSKELQWTFVTGRTQRVRHNDRISPAHASIHGLAGSLALECARWKLRLLDVDALTRVSAAECLSLPWDKRGHAMAYRGGEWLQQRLMPMETLPYGTPVYRKHGVYVVIGGAGGLGEVWSRFVVEKYQAHVIWIGRRPHDAAIEEKINALSRFGPAPVYLSADATDLCSLQQASRKILEIHPAIHGIVHSAIALHDQSIARMDEGTFRAGLSAKIDISVNMEKVFGEQELDFMLFFSSIISFFKTPDQSSYAAGCTFKDSFAQMLQQRRAYPVKTINWGYWGSVGVAADDLRRKIMEQAGIGSIEPREGMEILEQFLNSEIRQAAVIKNLNRQAAARLSMEDSAPAQSSMDVLKASSQEYVAPRNETEKQLVEIWAQILSLEPEKIGVNDSFFELGGHSLLGTQLLSQIRSQFDIDLPLMTLFQHTTVAQLAKLIDHSYERIRV